MSSARRATQPGGSATAIVAAFGALLVGALGVLAIVASLSTSAGAHTALLQGSPGPGQRAGGTVDFIDLIYLEPVSRVAITLEDPSGDLIDGEVLNEDGQIIRYRMPALTETGRYIVRYTMISADGDDTESAFFFTYHPDATQPVRLGDADVPDNTSTIVATVAGVVLAVSLIGLALIFLTKLERDRAAKVAGAAPAQTEPADSTTPEA